MNEDTRLAERTWHNLYAATGISVGTAMLVYNKLRSPVLLWEGASQPAVESRNGIPVYDDLPSVVESGATGCWVWSSAPMCLSVQVHV